MSVATSTAIAIGIGASTAASAYGAHKASSAAKKASEQQSQSAREALAVQQQMYNQSRTDLGPYRQQGGQGLTALSGLLGLPAPPPEAPSIVGAPGGMPGGLVTLRAPTGQTKAVPADQVDYYLSRGATRG